MPKTSDIDLGKHLRILMKGRPGTRKTSAYGSFPGPIYVFMFDPDGVKPIRKLFPERTDIEYDFYNNKNLDAAEHQMRQILSTGKYNNGLVAIDSLTFAADASMNYALDNRPAKSTNVEDASGASDRGIIKLPGFKEFNCENNFILGMLSFGFLFKGTFVLCSHIIDTPIENAQKQVVRHHQRLLTGGKVLADKVLAQFKERWHFEMESPIDSTKPNSYFVYTQSVDENIASTELPLPRKMDITKDRLWDVLKRELDKSGMQIK